MVLRFTQPAPGMLLGVVPISSTSTKGSPVGNRASTIESPDGSRHGPARTRCPRSVHAADSMLLAVVPISSRESTKGLPTSTIALRDSKQQAWSSTSLLSPPMVVRPMQPGAQHAAGDGGDLLKVDQELLLSSGAAHPPSHCLTSTDLLSPPMVLRFSQTDFQPCAQHAGGGGGHLLQVDQGRACASGNHTHTMLPVLLRSRRVNRIA
jgi:hypothetical protein